MGKTGAVVGVPKEIMPGERRVAVTGETCRKLCDQGLTVLIESGAGEGSYISDADYRAAGGRIVSDVEELYAGADLILKVKEPRFSPHKDRHEVSMMRSGQYLVTFIHPASPSNHEMVRQLASQGVISLTLDSVPRISRAQSMDALTSMSTVAGYKAVLMAANRLPCFMAMVSTAVGMIRPAQVLVVGTGVAGLQALATAKRLGAVVYAADIRPAAREQAASLGAKIVDLGVPDEISVASGGYAQALPSDWLKRERQALAPAVAASDAVILSALVPGRLAPCLVTHEMVKGMKAGSAIVDIAVDQGGNCESTSAGELIVRDGVSIDGTKNIPGMVPVSSTRMFASNICNFVGLLVRDAKLHLDRQDEIIASCLVTCDGRIVHAGALEAMGLPTVTGATS